MGLVVGCGATPVPLATPLGVGELATGRALELPLPLPPPTLGESVLATGSAEEDVPGLGTTMGAELGPGPAVTVE